MTIVQIIAQGAARLAAAGVESPRLDAEWLVAHALGKPRLHLFLEPGTALTEAQRTAVEELVARRAGREPLQYVLGTAVFCGLELTVGPEVLAPRPETELLAERAWRFLVSVAEPGPALGLDYGTGSGCLAITLATRCPDAVMHAVDISDAALSVARGNAVRHGVSDRVHFHHGDGFAAAPVGLRVDLIVANPPYIPSAQIAELQPEVRDFEPRLALDGGPDGLDFYRRLATDGANWLRPGGRLMLEMGDEQAEHIRRLFVESDWLVEAIEPDYSGRLRILVARPAGV